MPSFHTTPSVSTSSHSARVGNTLNPDTASTQQVWPAPRARHLPCTAMVVHSLSSRGEGQGSCCGPASTARLAPTLHRAGPSTCYRPGEKARAVAEVWPAPHALTPTLHRASRPRVADQGRRLELLLRVGDLVFPQGAPKHRQSRCSLGLHRCPPGWVHVQAQSRRTSRLLLTSFSSSALPRWLLLCSPAKGKFQQEKMRTTPSGSGTTCALAGKATSGTQTCGPIHGTVSEKPPTFPGLRTSARPGAEPRAAPAPAAPPLPHQSPRRCPPSCPCSTPSTSLSALLVRSTATAIE